MNDEFPQANWTGVKILGRGGFGVVGHWSYSIAQRNLPRYTDVAVKEVDNVDDELTKEGDTMRILGRFSEHVVRLVKPPRPEPIADEEEDSEWNGLVKRLVMEYCTQGSLLNAITRRRFS